MIKTSFKKTWAIFSGIGFALLITATISALRNFPKLNLLNNIGIAIFAIGIILTLYTSLVLSIHTIKRPFQPIRKGVYRIFKHPLYFGGGLASLGLSIVFLISRDTGNLLITIGAIVCFILAAKLENNYNRNKFITNT